MPSTDRTFIIPVSLGSADDYPTRKFKRRKPNTSFGKGELFLELSLSEILKIKEMSKATGADITSEFAKIKKLYDQLVNRRDMLEQQKPSFKPWILLSAHRESRSFMLDAEQLFQVTRRTSDHLGRTCVSIPSEDLSPVTDGGVMPGECLAGISVPSVNSPLTNKMATTLSEVGSIFASQADTSTIPFTDSTESAVMSEAPESSNTAVQSAVNNNIPSSDVCWSLATQTEVSSTNRGPGLTQNIFFSNSILATGGSTVSNPTLNASGSNNRGAIINQQVVIPSEPSDNNSLPPLLLPPCDLAVGDNGTAQMPV